MKVKRKESYDLKRAGLKSLGANKLPSYPQQCQWVLFFLSWV